MAKNFIDQLLDMAGLKLPDANGHYSPSVYREEPSPASVAKTTKTVPPKTSAQKTVKAQKGEDKLTGVAKYLAKKYPEPKAPEPVSETPATGELTRVERYLAKKQQEAQQKAEAEAAALAKMTRVERYLAKLEGKITTVETPTEQESSTPRHLSRVEQYLARKDEKAPVQSQPKTQEHVVQAVKPATKEPQTAPAKPAAAQPSSPAAKTPSKTINLAENASQCQAATNKGTQCRRTANLEALEKTINHQKYKFAVCSQHHNKDMTPFAELIE